MMWMRLLRGSCHGYLSTKLRLATRRVDCLLEKGPFQSPASTSPSLGRRFGLSCARWCSRPRFGLSGYMRWGFTPTLGLSSLVLIVIFVLRDDGGIWELSLATTGAVVGWDLGLRIQFLLMLSLDIAMEISKT